MPAVQREPSRERGCGSSAAARRPRSASSPGRTSRSSPIRPASSPTSRRRRWSLAPVRTGGGMRMKVLEALAAAKAVVTTPRGAEGFTVFEESRRSSSRTARGASPSRQRSAAAGGRAEAAERLGRARPGVRRAPPQPGGLGQAAGGGLRRGRGRGARRVADPAGERRHPDPPAPRGAASVALRVARRRRRRLRASYEVDRRRRRLDRRHQEMLEAMEPLPMRCGPVRGDRRRPGRGLQRGDRGGPAARVLIILDDDMQVAPRASSSSTSSNHPSRTRACA